MSATLPVLEVFGPTVQGEGPLAGAPTFFVRFGLCSFRCRWCDSLFAVLPELVKANAEQLSVAEILERLEGLAGERAESWVTLSGGDPAIHDLTEFVVQLHERGWKVSIETQGVNYRGWLAQLDSLVVSPKPPSSGMVSAAHDRKYERFISRLEMIDSAPVAVKIVVFDDADYEWARQTFPLWKHVAGAGLFLSVGTDITEPLPTTTEARETICERMHWLYEKLANDREMVGVKAIPQLHVLAFGHARGV